MALVVVAVAGMVVVPVPHIVIALIIDLIMAVDQVMYIPQVRLLIIHLAVYLIRHII